MKTLPKVHSFAISNNGYAKPHYAQMAWVIPEHSREKINFAGSILVDGNAPSHQQEAAFVIIDNWRSSHNFPLNTLQHRLRKKAKSVDESALVAQRIKRLSSIELKLKRYPDMNLSRMQDIGGCRAVLSSIGRVDKLINIYEHGSRGVKHVLKKKYDYITCPKESGYRGVHLIYAYKSAPDSPYNDLRIEIQIRTLFQHYWATAVETVGTFTKQSLKSSQGEKDWLRFFALMGTYFAMEEHRPPVPNTPTNRIELKQEIIKYRDILDVARHLGTFRDSFTILDMPEFRRAHYYLLQLDPTINQIRVGAYKWAELSQANRDYIRLERQYANTNVDVVLVSAESLQALKRAYPNYFLDTDKFLLALQRATES